MLNDYPVYVSIPVNDLQRAVAWYAEKLGFTPADDPPLPNGDEGIFFDAGEGTRFYLYPTRMGAGAGHTVAEFAVGDDFDAVIEGLRERGVVFEEYDLPGLKTERGVLQLHGPQAHRVAWLKDSEGNALAIGSYGRTAGQEGERSREPSRPPVVAGRRQQPQEQIGGQR